MSSSLSSNPRYPPTRTNASGTPDSDRSRMADPAEADVSPTESTPCPLWGWAADTREIWPLYSCPGYRWSPTGRLTVEVGEPWFFDWART